MAGQTHCAAQDGPAALTQQLLAAQRSLPTAQNALLTVWINYLDTRLQLYRDLELMPLDARGVWIDQITDCDCGIGVLASAKPVTVNPVEGRILPSEPVSATTQSAKRDEKILPPELLRLPEANSDTSPPMITGRIAAFQHERSPPLGWSSGAAEGERAALSPPLPACILSPRIVTQPSASSMEGTLKPIRPRVLAECGELEFKAGFDNTNARGWCSGR